MLSSLPRAVKYENESLFILDQTKLPTKIEIIKLNTVSDVYEAIKSLRVRGAPAIGIAGAYGLLVGLKPFINIATSEDFKAKAAEIADYLDSARPTAVNLGWALKRMVRAGDFHKNISSPEIYSVMKKEADCIYNEDASCCRRIGAEGARLIKNGCGVLTHCNAGALAVSELGTALAPIYTAMERGLSFRVYADETRPLLQGARLTAWELSVSGADITLICDSMAAYVMSKKLVDLIIVGCDRVAANGDTANKIGTLSLAVLAKHFGIPFYVACPCSTYDDATPSGEFITIEERPEYEVTTFGGVKTAPDGIKVINPAFDITPAELITAFITDKGIITPPFKETLKILEAKQ